MQILQPQKIILKLPWQRKALYRELFLLDDDQYILQTIAPFAVLSCALKEELMDSVQENKRCNILIVWLLISTVTVIGLLVLHVSQLIFTILYRFCIKNFLLYCVWIHVFFPRFKSRDLYLCVCHGWTSANVVVVCLRSNDEYDG